MRNNNTQCASTQATKHTTTAAAHRESGCSPMQAHCSRSCPAAHSESLQPSAAFRGLPRPSAAFHGAHCMPVPWAFRAFRASRHVPRIPRSTRHDATRGIRGWLLAAPQKRARFGRWLWYFRAVSSVLRLQWPYTIAAEPKLRIAPYIIMLNE